MHPDCPNGTTAELEALARLAAVRNVCDAFVGGHWPLDSGLILLVAELIDQAGAWTMVAEEAGRRQAA